MQQRAASASPHRFPRNDNLCRTWQKRRQALELRLNLVREMTGQQDEFRRTETNKLAHQPREKRAITARQQWLRHALG